MMYSEFVENTGCRDNDYNREVFRKLEIVYMNDESMSKAEVYEWGKKLVNNDLTDEQKEWNQDRKTEIKFLTMSAEEWKERLVNYRDYARSSVTSEDRKYWNEEVKYCQDKIKIIRVEIRHQKELIIK